MSNAPGAQQNPQYCMIAGALNVSFDNGATWTPIGGSGGTVQTASPVSGDGSSGNKVTIANGDIPLTKLATQAANTLVGNGTGSAASPTALTASQALSALGIGPGSWRQQMFAFAQSNYPTLRSDFLVDFTEGTGGDYVQVNAANTGFTAISNAFNSGAVVLSSNSASGGAVGVVGIGQPVIAALAKTGAPWFYAARAKLTTAITGTTVIEFGPTNAPAAYSSGMPFVGVNGATSTTNLILSSGLVTGVATATAIPSVNASFDVGIGFDGATITGFFGDLFLGTFVSIATSTTLSQFADTSIGPGAFVSAGATTNLLGAVVDKIYMAVGGF